MSRGHCLLENLMVTHVTLRHCYFSIAELTKRKLFILTRKVRLNCSRNYKKSLPQCYGMFQKALEYSRIFHNVTETPRNVPLHANEKISDKN